MRETVVKTEEFKNSPLGKIPTDWDVVSIDKIAIYVGSGITPRGGSNVYKKECILFIRSQNVTFNGLRLDDVAYIDNRTHESMKRSEVFAHDVLLNITGASIGRCCPVPPGLDAANVNQHVCAIRLPNPNREDAIFLSSVLASYIGQSQID
ncbi:MAG: restriction endonuclease subunit S, partial [Microcoleus sp. T1-bin1]|nr:restriction endonuclease subunit S [Microcoleus sp. T1-bin1]